MCFMVEMSCAVKMVPEERLKAESMMQDMRYYLLGCQNSP